jgi:hypothetical protein
MTFKTTTIDQSKKEERLAHRTATMKFLAHAFGTCHCHTTPRATKAKARAKPTHKD